LKSAALQWGVDIENKFPALKDKLDLVRAFRNACPLAFGWTSKELLDERIAYINYMTKT
jgi:hypothetical protein